MYLNDTRVWYTKKRYLFPLLALIGVSVFSIARTEEKQNTISPMQAPLTKSVEDLVTPVETTQNNPLKQEKTLE